MRAPRPQAPGRSEKRRQREADVKQHDKGDSAERIDDQGIGGTFDRGFDFFGHVAYLDACLLLICSHVLNRK